MRAGSSSNSRPLPPQPRQLGDGLVLRSATGADAEPLAEFNALVHGGSAQTPDLQAAIWTRDLLRGDHPTSPVSDFTIVEDVERGRIASSCLLISQTWTYGGIPFGVGRPEMVGTHPDYRGRGLIRTQFDLLHRRSAECGQVMQALTGIPHYYRQFGYEPALINPPPRIGLPTAIDAAPAGNASLRFRIATPEDVPFIVAMYERAARRSLIAAVRDKTIWRYELTGRDPGSDYCHDLFVIETGDGSPVGLIALPNRLTRGSLVSPLIEARDSVSWPLITESALRFVRDRGAEFERRDGQAFSLLGFDLVPDHPLLRLATSRLPATGDPFAWEIRIPDLAAFLRVITPVLEMRLGASPLAGYTGDLEITFYRSGLRLSFADGRLDRIEPWLPAPVWRAETAFPGQSLLYLLCGSRSLDQLQPAFPDLRIRSDLARLLIETLFPVAPSVVWPVG